MKREGEDRTGVTQWKCDRRDQYISETDGVLAHLAISDRPVQSDGQVWG
jgi:hypothetical protein